MERPTDNNRTYAMAAARFAKPRDIAAAIAAQPDSQGTCRHSKGIGKSQAKMFSAVVDSQNGAAWRTRARRAMR